MCQADLAENPPSSKVTPVPCLFNPTSLSTNQHIIRHSTTCFGSMYITQGWICRAVYTFDEVLTGADQILTRC